MIAAHNFRQSEFRERATQGIVEMLTQLPETQRNIFVWNHYRGYAPKQIAEILKCSASDVETNLDVINSILYQRTRCLIRVGFDSGLVEGGDTFVDLPIVALPEPFTNRSRRIETLAADCPFCSQSRKPDE